jgi:hypothetical protein
VVRRARGEHLLDVVQERAEVVSSACASSSALTMMSKMVKAIEITAYAAVREAASAASPRIGEVEAHVVAARRAGAVGASTLPAGQARSLRSGPGPSG